MSTKLFLELYTGVALHERSAFDRLWSLLSEPLVGATKWGRYERTTEPFTEEPAEAHRVFLLGKVLFIKGSRDGFLCQLERWRGSLVFIKIWWNEKAFDWMTVFGSEPRHVLDLEQLRDLPGVRLQYLLPDQAVCFSKSRRSLPTSTPVLRSCASSPSASAPIPSSIARTPIASCGGSHRSSTRSSGSRARHEQTGGQNG
jgi:hypothetical protein